MSTDCTVREVTQNVTVEPGNSLLLQYSLIYDMAEFKSIRLELAVVLLDEAHASVYMGQCSDIPVSNLDRVPNDVILVYSSYKDTKTIPVSFQLLTHNTSYPSHNQQTI
jgi:hypothetical protein